jgi:hypothetical protein
MDSAMHNVLLLQLPIPQLNYGRQTGNIPLGAACLKLAATTVPGVSIEILPESTVSYLADAPLLRLILSRRPDVIGFTVYCWNVRRSLYLAEKIKEHYQPRIVFGGPEVTPDNRLIRSDNVDFRVYGEGEAVLRRLLQDTDLWKIGSASDSAGPIFESDPSPYPGGLLEPDIENMMLLETQRGCPYQCGYCYYNKSRERITVKDETLVLDGVQWALEQDLAELFLLDPSLNIRPGLKNLLKKIAGMNRSKSLALLSEIRAEAVDAEAADLFAAAGFNWFEIGLQTTSAKALKIMNRPTDLQKFLAGTGNLKQRGITPAIDLIAGLPGDNLSGFKRSVDFIIENELQEDIQVFPLSVLPGTDFREKSRQLGLRYEPEPPYPVIETPTFSREDMLLAFDYAEVMFDVCLYPLPDLDLAWRLDSSCRFEETPDLSVRLNHEEYIAKLVIGAERSLSELEKKATRLTHPYQVIIGPGVRNRQYIAEVVEILTAANPHTPCELVFMAPDNPPDTSALLGSVKIRRPHFLDHDQRLLFATPGNRTVMFTLVSNDRKPRFNKDMQRQVYWWRDAKLPDLEDLKMLSELDGILLDPTVAIQSIKNWQDRLAGSAAEHLFISFADVALQKRWTALTVSDDYYFGAFSN